MHVSFALLPLIAAASPAFAQASTAPAPPQAIQLQRALTDPANAQRLAGAMQTVSKAFLDLPVGEIQAAVEGRAPSAAEKKLTVRDLGRRNDPDFDRNFQRQIAQSKPMIEQSMKAFAAALPEMMKGLQNAEQALERATANMPRPDYPKR